MRVSGEEGMGVERQEDRKEERVRCGAYAERDGV